MWIYLAHHALFGAVTRFAFQRLIHANRVGRFPLSFWAWLVLSFAYSYWFVGYVGFHVRTKSAETAYDGLAVPLLCALLVAGFFIAHRRSRMRGE